MVESEKLHSDHGRARTYGAVAEEYERYRPALADELIADIVRLKPGRVLDVGCGTGRVAIALGGHGIPVLGVEVDERMAEVARARGVDVEVSPFETWDDDDRRFDLVVCGDAWHWLDPAGAVTMAARVLSDAGTLVRFWNVHELDDELYAATVKVYETYAPGVRAPGFRYVEDKNAADAVADSDAFLGVTTKTYRWELSRTGEDWVNMATTLSMHRSLEPDRLDALRSSLRETIRDFGDHVTVYGSTITMFARRASRPISARS